MLGLGLGEYVRADNTKFSMGFVGLSWLLIVDGLGKCLFIFISCKVLGLGDRVALSVHLSLEPRVATSVGMWSLNELVVRKLEAVKEGINAGNAGNAWINRDFWIFRKGLKFII